MQQRLDEGQREALSRLMEAEDHARTAGAVLADPMGSGKTHVLCALMTARPFYNAASLVICAPATLTFWRDTLRAARGSPPAVALPRTRVDARTLASAGEVVLVPWTFFLTPAESSMPVAAFAAELLAVPWGRVIVDEADRLLKRGQYARALLDACRAQFRWAVSGSTREDGLTHARLTDLVEWARASRDGRAPVVSTRLSADGDEPGALAEAVALDFSTAAEAELSAQLEALRLKSGSSSAALRCRQLCAGLPVLRRAVEAHCASARGKLAPADEACRRWLLEHPGAGSSAKVAHAAAAVAADVASGDRAVVFCEFAEEARALAEALAARGVACARAAGDVPIADQNAAVDALELGQVDALVLTLRTGASGLNLQTARAVYILAHSGDAFRRAQVRARVVRKGQATGRARLVYIYMRGTVEEAPALAAVAEAAQA